MDGKETLRHLMEGNRRFVEGKSEHSSQSLMDRLLDYFSL